MQHLSRRLADGHDEFLGQADLTELAALKARSMAPGPEAAQTNIHSAVTLAAQVKNDKTVTVSGRRAPEVEKSNRFITLPYFPNDAIQIDGLLDDWKNMPALRLDLAVEGKVAGVVKVEAQKAWAAYTNRGLLLAVDVVDTTGKIEKDKPMTTAYWTNDAVEVFVDALNAKFPRRWGGNAMQLLAVPFGHKEHPAAVAFEITAANIESTKWKVTTLAPETIRSAAVKTQAGWSMEMLIPRSLLGRESAKPGQIIGLNLKVDTGSSTYFYLTYRDKVVMTQRPDAWADALLLGTDAKLELLDDFNEPLTAICPGRPLQLRITDPDMNTDDAKRDRVGVVIHTKSGSREMVLLEETANASGIFDGIVPTRLSTGFHVTGALDVLEGETATIEYLDQARADGERNVRLKKTVAVGSIGKRVEK